MIHTYCIILEEFNSYRSYNVYISRVLSDILNIQYNILYNRIKSVYTMIKLDRDVVLVCLYRSTDNRLDDPGGGYHERCPDTDCRVPSYRGDHL